MHASAITPPPFTTVHPLSATIPHPIFRPRSKHTLFKPQIHSRLHLTSNLKATKKAPKRTPSVTHSLTVIPDDPVIPDVHRHPEFISGSPQRAFTPYFSKEDFFGNLCSRYILSILFPDSFAPELLMQNNIGRRHHNINICFRSASE